MKLTFSDSSKFRMDYDYTFKTNTQKGLKKLLNWYQSYTKKNEENKFTNSWWGHVCLW